MEQALQRVIVHTPLAVSGQVWVADDQVQLELLLLVSCLLYLASSVFQLNLIQEQVYEDISVTCSMKNRTLRLQA